MQPFDFKTGDYFVAQGSSISALESVVESKMKEGYVPVSGVSTGGGNFYQTLLKPLQVPSLSGTSGDLTFDPVNNRYVPKFFIR